MKFCQLRSMSVCSGEAYKPQVCTLQFTIPPAYYVMHLVWLLVQNGVMSSTCQYLHIGVVYKVLAHSHRSTVVPIIGCSAN